MQATYLRLYWCGVTHCALRLMKQLFLIICKQYKCAAHNSILLLFDTCLCALRTSQFLTYPASRVFKYKTPVLGSSWNVSHSISEGYSMSLGMQLMLPNVSQQVPEHAPASVLSRLTSLQNIWTLPQFLSISSIIKNCKAYKKHKKEHWMPPVYSADRYFIHSSIYDRSSKVSEFKISYTMSEKPPHAWGEYGSRFTAFTWI